MCELEDPERIAQLLRKAFRVVRRNYGCPGPDGVAIREIHSRLGVHVEELCLQLLAREIQFAPGREVAIRTGQHTVSERKVRVYNVRERWLQCYLRLSIEPIIDAALTDAVYSYRRGRTRYDGLRVLLQAKPELVLVLDVRNFFGSLVRDRVEEMLRREGVGSFIAQLVVRAIDHEGPGLPKGNSLSPVIANLYLKSIDAMFRSSYVRFSDDMFFGVPDMRAARDVERKVAASLAKLGLELSDEKRRVAAAPPAESICGEYPWFV